MDELEAKLVENIANSDISQAEQKAKIKNLENEINALKDKLASHKKKGFAGAAAVRILEWAKDPINRKVLTTGAQVTTELLLEAGKHMANGK